MKNHDNVLMKMFMLHYSGSTDELFNNGFYVYGSAPDYYGTGVLKYLPSPSRFYAETNL